MVAEPPTLADTTSVGSAVAAGAPRDLFTDAGRKSALLDFIAECDLMLAGADTARDQAAFMGHKLRALREIGLIVQADAEAAQAAKEIDAADRLESLIAEGQDDVFVRVDRAPPFRAPDDSKTH